MNRLPRNIMEEILLELPMEDLLARASGVCRQWNDLINTSPRIQEKLFKRADVARDGNRMLPWTPNPLTEEWFIWHDSSIRHPIELEDRFALTHARTSWRDMFIAKPTPSVVILQFTDHNVVRHNPTGITIGELADLVKGDGGGNWDEAPSRVVLL